MNCSQFEKIKEDLKVGKEVKLKLISYESLPKSWHERFPIEQYNAYHSAINKLQNKVITVERINLTNNAILISESSIAFGGDIFDVIDDDGGKPFLDDSLFIMD